MKNENQLKVGFQNDMKLKKIPNTKQRWIVQEEIRYYSAITNEAYTIPKGFLTDLASVPRCLQWLFSPDDHQYKWEACLHDYLYVTPTTGVCREEADLIFKEAMRVGVVDKWKEWCLYTAVRLFGWKYFKYI